MRRGLMRFWGEERGAVLAFLVILLPVMLLIGGIATDITMLNAQKRYTQSQADLAAQSAARFLPDPAAVRAEVRRVVAANGHYGDLTLSDADIVLGSWAGRGKFVPLPEQGIPAGATAVKVTVPSPFQPFLWGSLLNLGDVMVRKSAIGRNQALVVFTLRNRLLGLDTKKSILDAVLGPAGLGLSTSVLSYAGLAGVKVNLNDLLRLADASIALDTLTFDDVLDLPIGIDSLLHGLVSLKALPAASVLSVGTSLGKLTFRDLLTTSPGFLTAKAGDVLPDISVSALDLLTGFAALASRPEQRIGVTTGLDLAPLTAVSLDLGLIRPPVTVIARPGATPPTVAHLDQVSLSVTAEALGLLSLGAVVEVAEARATLSQVQCSGLNARAVFDVSTFPAGIDLRLGLRSGVTFSTPRPMARIPIAGKQQTVAIPIKDIGKVVPISNPISLAGAANDANNVLKQLKKDVEDEKARVCKGVLGCVLGTVSALLGAVLGTLNGLLDGLTGLIGQLDQQGAILNALLKLLGIDVAQAELILNAVSCGGGLVE